MSYGTLPEGGVTIGDQSIELDENQRLTHVVTVPEMVHMARSFGADEVTVYEDCETASVDIQVEGMGVRSRRAFMQYVRRHKPPGTAVSIEPGVPDEVNEGATHAQFDRAREEFEAIKQHTSDSVAAAVSDYVDGSIDIYEFEERLDDMSLETIEEYCKYA